jgi:hypothetical protein
MPNTVGAQSKTQNVFVYSITEIVGLYPCWGTNYVGSLGCVSTCATTQLEARQYARRRSNDQTETCTSSRKEANTRTYLPVWWERETCVTFRLYLAHPFCACLCSCILLPLRMQPTHVSHCMRSCTSGIAATVSVLSCVGMCFATGWSPIVQRVLPAVFKIHSFKLSFEWEKERGPNRLTIWYIKWLWDWTFLSPGTYVALSLRNYYIVLFMRMRLDTSIKDRCCWTTVHVFLATEDEPVK